MFILTDAIRILNKKIPEREIVGYWRKGNNYIFNTVGKKQPESYTCSQFIVEENGDVKCTNPIISDLSEEDMIKL